MGGANTKPWFTNAHERPAWFADFERLLVDEGLCDWAGRGKPPPQDTALVAYWGLKKLGVIPDPAPERHRTGPGGRTGDTDYG